MKTNFSLLCNNYTSKRFFILYIDKVALSHIILYNDETSADDDMENEYLHCNVTPDFCI